MRHSTIGLVIFALLVSAMPVWADVVDDGLPPTVSEQVRTQTRAMIRVGVPAADAVEMTRSMIQHQFRYEETLRAQRQVVAACEEGLPHEPLFNKLQEGLAKQVPPEDIVKAMQRVRERYRYAYQYARQITSDKAKQRSLGEAQAQGIAAGLKTKDMQRINEQVRERIRLKTCDNCPQLARESTLAARDMARLGVDSGTTGDVVCRALENGYDNAQMLRMRHQFRARVRYDDPQGLANRYAHAFRNGQDPLRDRSGMGSLGGGRQNRGEGAGGANGSGGSGGKR